MSRWVLLVLTVLVVVQAYWLWRAESALRQMRSPISERIVERTRELVPGERTVTEVRVVTVPRPVPVTVTRTIERVQVSPGQTRVVERVITEAPPVPCRTDEECRRIYASAPQSITAHAHLQAGTPVPVTLDSRELELPLSRDLPVQIQLVRTEEGVWAAVQRADSPLRVDRVETATTVPPQQPQADRGRLKAVVALGPELAAGVAVEIGSVWRLQLDAVGLYGTSTRSVSVGLGAGYELTRNWSVGVSQTWTVGTWTPQTWLYASARW